MQPRFRACPRQLCGIFWPDRLRRVFFFIPALCRRGMPPGYPLFLVLAEGAPDAKRLTWRLRLVQAHGLADFFGGLFDFL